MSMANRSGIRSVSSRPSCLRRSKSRCGVTTLIPVKSARLLVRMSLTPGPSQSRLSTPVLLVNGRMATEPAPRSGPIATVPGERTATSPVLMR